MNITNPREVITKSLEVACGFDAYLKTLALHDIDISSDVEYQKNFTGYYRVRRDKEWLQEYYNYMEAHKNDTELSFENILRATSTIPHKVKKTPSNNGFATSIEPSFASKMLATLKPDHPIWDSQVVRTLNITVDPSLSGEEKIQSYVHAYEQLTLEIRNFIQTKEGNACIKQFDITFPNLKYISPFKKIDYYLWNIGK